MKRGYIRVVDKRGTQARLPDIAPASGLGDDEIKHRATDRVEHIAREIAKAFLAWQDEIRFQRALAENVDAMICDMQGASVLPEHLDEWCYTLHALQDVRRQISTSLSGLESQLVTERAVPDGDVQS